MLELKSGSKNYGINLPTDLKEITPEILTEITNGIKIPKYHAIVALCFQVKLSDVAINVSGNKETTVSVIPMLAKISDEDATLINTTIGDKIVVDRSSLERGTHINIAIMAASNNVKHFIREDETLRNNLLKGGNGTIESLEVFDINQNKKRKDDIVLSKSPQVYILEFKIIPVNDIKASIPVDSITTDPFKIKSSILVN